MSLANTSPADVAPPSLERRPLEAFAVQGAGVAARIAGWGYYRAAWGSAARARIAADVASTAWTVDGDLRYGLSPEMLGAGAAADWVYILGIGPAVRGAIAEWTVARARMASEAARGGSVALASTTP